MNRLGTNYLALRQLQERVGWVVLWALGVEAVVGTIVAPITLATTIAIPSNRSGVAGTALFLVAMVAYYGVFSRHRLVAQAPLEAALLEAAQTEFSP